jgi:hypothetical protein
MSMVRDAEKSNPMIFCAPSWNSLT